MDKTPIYKIDENLWVKREDFIPFSFGGNKARKAILFFQDFDKGNYDCVVTYGSSSSNHSRIIANICASRSIPCYIICPLESSEKTYNSKLIDLFGAKIQTIEVSKVHETIDFTIESLKKDGKRPYFIQGGGHGNIGTQAYVDCYNEIKEWETKHRLHFDYIFFASGTGTTQAGLICGQLLNKDERNIIGISIARENPRGREVVINSVKDYLGEKAINADIEHKTIFIDKYIKSGYGGRDTDVKGVIKFAITQYGLPLDETYTGKAFFGMQEYLKENKISNNNILFIHTGGTPLFFNYLDD